MRRGQCRANDTTVGAERSNLPNVLVGGLLVVMPDASSPDRAVLSAAESGDGLRPVPECRLFAPMPA